MTAKQHQQSKENFPVAQTKKLASHGVLPRGRVVNPSTALQRALAAPSSALKAHDLLTLQKTFGNQAVGRLLRSPTQARRRKPTLPIQTKLTVGHADDLYEREADRLAEQVLSTPVLAQSPLPQHGAESVERVRTKRPEVTTKQLAAQVRTEAGGEVQTQSFVEHGADGEPSAVGPEIEAAIERGRGGGQSLPSDVRARMENAFDADFGGVRVHTGVESDRLNRSLESRAFTTGQSVFFRQGEYDPQSHAGQKLIAHELTHVLQQNGGAVRRKRKEGESRELSVQTHDVATGASFVLKKAREPDGSRPVTGSSGREKILYRKPSAIVSPVGPRVIQRAKQLTGTKPGNNYQYQYRGTRVDEEQGFKKVSKKQATEVEALIPQNPAYGSVPYAEPAGWYWLAEHLPSKVIAHTTTATTSTMRRPGWVRFHVLNDNLGGSGKKEANLVPTRQSDNLSSQWSTFETNAKTQSQLSPIHFYAEVAYHPAQPASLLDPGNIHLGFFPNRIHAEYSTWDGINWNVAGQTTLTPQPPGTKQQLVQYELTSATASELKALGISDWLSSVIITNRNHINARVNGSTTKQDLFNLIASVIPTTNTDQNKLNAYWPDLQNVLNKSGGMELHIVLNNRGGSKDVTVGNSMIGLFKTHSRQQIQGLSANRLQGICVYLIIQHDLMGKKIDQLVPERALYDLFIRDVLYGEVEQFDKVWEADLFAPFKGDYILPIRRENITKRSEEIDNLKQNLIDEFGNRYNNNNFVKGNSEAKVLVKEFLNNIKLIHPNVHQNTLNKLQEVVKHMDEKLHDNITRIYNSEKEKQELLKRQQQQQQPPPPPQTFSSGSQQFGSQQFGSQQFGFQQQSYPQPTGYPNSNYQPTQPTFGSQFQQQQPSPISMELVKDVYAAIQHLLPPTTQAIQQPTSPLQQTQLGQQLTNTFQPQQQHPNVYQQPQTFIPQQQTYFQQPPQPVYGFSQQQQPQPVYGFSQSQQQPQPSYNFNPQPSREQLWGELQRLEGWASQNRLNQNEYQRLQYLRSLFQRY